ncbi:MAG: response regulator [Thermodesulfobacteriota bacterium]
MARILVIEDEELLRNLYSELLEMKGFKVDTSTDGQEALEFLKDTKPDLMLLDVNMPNIDGVEFLRIIKKDNKLKKIPVLLITGVIQVEKISACLDLGAVGYIEKANSPVEVISKIEMILGAVINSYNDGSNFNNVGPKKISKIGDLEIKSL